MVLFLNMCPVVVPTVCNLDVNSKTEKQNTFCKKYIYVFKAIMQYWQIIFPQWRILATFYWFKTWKLVFFAFFALPILPHLSDFLTDTYQIVPIREGSGLLITCYKSCYIDNFILKFQVKKCRWKYVIGVEKTKLSLQGYWSAATDPFQCVEEPSADKWHGQKIHGAL